MEREGPAKRRRIHGHALNVLSTNTLGMHLTLNVPWSSLSIHEGNAFICSFGRYPGWSSSHSMVVVVDLLLQMGEWHLVTTITKRPGGEMGVTFTRRDYDEEWTGEEEVQRVDHQLFSSMFFCKHNEKLMIFVTVSILWIKIFGQDGKDPHWGSLKYKGYVIGGPVG